ncbi:MAG TPA: GAF domain-containing protein [Phycisphaerae bacterium]|nr:GAF domain-containing protein [Phycisphaerae bacterium]
MRRFFFASLRFRLLLLILLAVVPVLGVTFYTNVNLRRLIAADAKKEALRLVRIAASDQEDTVKDTRQLLFAVAQLPELHSTDPVICSEFLIRLLAQYPQYVLLGVIGRDGYLSCSAPPIEVPVDLTDLSSFRRVLQTLDFAIGDYRSDLVGDRATLDFGCPVFDEAGQAQSVVFALLDLTWLNRLVAEAQLPEGSSFTVIDRNGTVLTRYPDPEVWVGQSGIEAPIIEVVLTQRGEGTVETSGIDGIPRLFAFTPLSGAPSGEDVYVAIGIPTSVAFADANRVLARNLIILGLVLILVFAVAWFGGNLSILRGVKALVSTTRHLATGDLSARTGLPHGVGELGQLARAFDEMAGALEHRVAERDRAEEALRESQQLLERRVADRTRELSALYEVAAVASTSLDLETILQNSLDRVLAVIEIEVGAVHLYDEATGTLRLAAQRGVPPHLITAIESVPITDSLAGQVVESAEPLVVPDVATGLRPLLAVPAGGSRAYVGAPMRAKGRVLGVLSVVGRTGRQFGEDDVTLLSSIADQVGVAVENARLYQQAEQLAVVKERERLARELHDSVTQSLYSLMLLAEAGRQLAAAGDFDRIAGYLERLNEISQQALKEMRLLVYELRPLALSREGLVGALQQRLDAVEKRAGVDARLLVEGESQLPASAEEALYRIAQEALNNALKHAVPTRVTVRIQSADDRVTLEVVDDGVGFDPSAIADRGGMGLISIRERVEKIGGTVEILSKPGEGTSVRVVASARL